MSKQLVTRIGLEKAKGFISSHRLEIGKCISCETDNIQVFTEEDLICPECFILEIKEWEWRIGSVSEFVFSDFFGRSPMEDTRAYKVGMSAYFETLEKWGK